MTSEEERRRVRALFAAVQSHKGLSSFGVLEAAKEYEQYLKG